MEDLLNSVTQGDCLELLRRVPSGTVDMVLCDLPYGTTQNKWDSVIPFAPLWEQYRRVCKPNAAIVLTASQPFTSALVMSNPAMFKHEWVWIKNRGSNYANTVREPFKEHESALVFSTGRWVYNPQTQPRTGSGPSKVGTRQNTPRNNGDNYGECAVRSGTPLTELRLPSSWQKFNTEVGFHPTQKPVALFEYLIRTYTNPGETVLDNCCGSGTTGVAVKRTGRNSIQFELSAEYCDIARRRLAEASLIAQESQ